MAAPLEYAFSAINVKERFARAPTNTLPVRSLEGGYRDPLRSPGRVGNRGRRNVSLRCALTGQTGSEFADGPDLHGIIERTPLDYLEGEPAPDARRPSRHTNVRVRENMGTN
eukprot:1194808-Prorocentrum_minimum.AAC.8